MFRSTLAFAALLCLSSGCERKRDREREGENPVVFANDIERFVAEIQKAETVTLYEGLPHQEREKFLLAKELKGKEVVMLHEFPFYDEPITPEEKVAKELTALCGDSKIFWPYSPNKCDGFHPDWCVEWKKDGKTYQASLCFGCYEARLYGPKIDLHSNVAGEPLKRLAALLNPHRKNRPEPPK